MVSIKYNDHNSRKLAQLAVEHMTDEELKAYVTTNLNVRYWLDPDDFYCFQGEEDEN